MLKVLSVATATGFVGFGLVMASAAPQQAAQGTAKPAAPAITKPASPEETDIRAVFQSFLVAYTKADAKALADIFLPEGILIDSDLNVTRGREAIAQHYAEIFEANDGKSIPATAKITTVSPLTADVARVEGQFALLSADGQPSYVGEFRALAVRRDGKWQIAEVRDDPAPVEIPESNQVYLKELEWMVGDWVDEGNETKVTSSIRWAENQNFLVRTYTVTAEGQSLLSGTQFIGYDPLGGQIKSWVFDSDGGHAEGLWTRAGENQWVVRTSGVMRDGTTNSSSQVITQVNKDSAKFRSFDRIVGGSIVPDIEEFVMVRKAPAPQPATPKP
jgi:uncharacterized protein (TIGR02246 family)